MSHGTTDDLGAPAADGIAHASQRNTPLPDRNRLWADSGFRCGNPDCLAPVLVEVSGSTVTLGKIAHIRGHRPNAARHDPNQDPAERESYDNLIILCDACHKQIDDLPESYPVERLLEWKRRQSSLLSASVLQASSLLSPPLAIRYIDRPELRHRVTESLASTGLVALCGISGSGKTQLAAHLLNEAEAEYSFRWWIRGTRAETLTGDLAAIAPAIRVPLRESESTRETARRVAQALSKLGTWLMVIDDLPGSAEELEFVPRGGGHVVITTQNSGIAQHMQTIQIPALSDAEGVVLLGGATSRDVSVQVHLAKINEICHGHPLVVAQAASYIAETGMNPQRFVDLFESQASELLGRGRAVGHEPLATSMRLAFSKLSPDAQFLLGVLSRFSSAPFPVSKLVVPVQELPPLNSELGIEDALADLRRFSLVQRDSDNVVVHALVKEVVQSERRADMSELFVSLALHILGTHLPERTERIEAWQTMAWLTPHILAVLASSKELPSSADLIVAEATLLNRTAVYFQIRGDIEQAERLLLRAAERLRLLSEPGDLAQLGSVLNNLGNIQKDRGDLTEAERTMREALRLKQAGHGEHHLLTAISLAALGVVVNQAGRTDEAQDLHQRALAIYEANGAVTRVADSLNDLAGIADSRGDIVETRRLLERSVDITRTVDEAWPETVRAYRGLAAVAQAEGNMQAAARAARQAVDVARKPGVPNKVLAEALHDRGMLMGRLGIVPTAINILKEALQMISYVEPPEPVVRAYILRDLGLFRMATSSHGTGLSNVRESDAIIGAHFPPNHPRVMTSKRILGRALAESGYLKESEQVLQKAIASCNDAGGCDELAWLDDDLATVRSALRRPELASAP